MGHEPVRLLLVEDNPGDARLIREMLRQADDFAFELMHVELLRDAASHLARGETDAVLLDLSLPDAQGLDTVLGALDAAADTPVIVLTGCSNDTTALEAVHAGAQDYLLKNEITGRLLVHSIRYALERGTLERERGDLLRREQRTRAMAEAALRTRDEVLAIVAHDLRNPLAAINTTVALLRQGEIPPEQCPHQLEAVLRSTEQMDRLIEDLLEVARIEGGTLRVAPREVSVGNLVAEAIVLFESQTRKAGIELRTEVEDGVPDVLADPQRVLQIFSNLIGNAMRFSPKGGTVTLRVRRFGDAVLLSVTDTGIGIPSEDLTHLFERGWQAEHARRDGTGRGLAISKGIVTAHHGRIWAASDVGRGSTIFFTLPALVGDSSSDEVGPSTDGPTAAEGESAEVTRPLRVLLVDDHPAILHGLAALLRATEWVEVVGEAFTGEDALARAEELRPDVVVMDLMMPGMGGIEATRQITASMPEIRVLALTAEAEEQTLAQVLRAGGSGFVRKTTAHDDLLPALSVVARDEVFLYPSGNILLLSDFLRDRALQDGAVARLNEQERKILLLAAEGYNSTEIGKKLFLSPKTIDSYRSRLMRQLGLSRRSDLVHMALHSGLLKAEAAGYRSAPDFRQRTSGSALPRFSAPSV